MQHFPKRGKSNVFGMKKLSDFVEESFLVLLPL